MEILFISEQLPFPPRNGITVVTSNLIKGLSKKGHNISLIYLRNSDESLELQSQNSSFFKDLLIVNRKRNSIILRIKDEILKKNLFSLGWAMDYSQISSFLSKNNFDIIFISPLCIDALFLAKCDMAKRSKLVAAISDCSTSVLRQLGHRALKKGLLPKQRLLFIINWIRSFWVGAIESNILSNFSMIMVQTETDKNWISNISSGKLKSKSIVLTNGVNDELFDLEITQTDNNLLFLGTLTEIYRTALYWFLKNIWPDLVGNIRNIKLFIVGKDSTNSIQNLLDKDNRIIYKPFIPQIKDVFDNKYIMISPVFKGYGIINKVLEAMAAGVPVVGDYTSFHGIPEFKNGIHGLIGNSIEEFKKSIFEIFSSPDKRNDIALSARDLVKKHFNWSNRINYLEQIISDL